MHIRVLSELPLVAILRGLRPDAALAVGAAVVDAGFRALEVPLNSPEPLESIRRLQAEFGDRCLVGAGTVLSAAAVHEVADAGGQLIVTPHTDVAIIAATKRRGLVSMPGTATPSEAFAALRAGADAIKVFPAEQIGPRVLRAWRAVLPPELGVFPVGGITPDNMRDYVAAGANGFGIGSALYKPGRALGEIAALAQRFVQEWATIAPSHAR
jgi:2-dehydro-3-deoxyphosphogalactonate aldolase